MTDTPPTGSAVADTDARHSAPVPAATTGDGTVRDATAGAAPARGAVRVAGVTASFWVLKALSTALGESASDYAVHAVAPVAAVLVGFLAFCVALAWQVTRGRYEPWAYWVAVAAVGVFGTMAADVLHVGLGIPYPVSSAAAAVALAAVFVAWQRTEHTLNVHNVDTVRREGFYWRAVVGTFALGTAVGDLAALTAHLGYAPSALLFAALIALPALASRLLPGHAVACFWAAYVLTRPVGASVADWLGKPRTAGGLGVGSGPVCAVLALTLLLGVGYARRSRATEPGAGGEPAGADAAAPRRRGGAGAGG